MVIFGEFFASCVSEMTYNVFSGTLNPTHFTASCVFSEPPAASFTPAS